MKYSERQDKNSTTDLVKNILSQGPTSKGTPVNAKKIIKVGKISSSTLRSLGFEFSGTRNQVNQKENKLRDSGKNIDLGLNPK